MMYSIKNYQIYCTVLLTIVTMQIIHFELNFYILHTSNLKSIHQKHINLF